MSVHVRDPEKWRTECQGCLREANNLVIFEIRREELSGSASTGITFALCQDCRGELQRELAKVPRSS